MIEGFRTQLDGKGPQAAEATEYFNPLLSSARRLVNETTARRGRADATSSSRSSRTVTAIAERRDDLADAGRQRERHDGRDRRREPRAQRGAGAAADDAAARQLDVREPARDARRPRPAGRGLQARDQGPGAVPARAAPARARRQADDRRPLARSCAARAPTTTWSTPRASCRASRRSRARRSRAAPARCKKGQPVLEFIRPYIPELVGWFRDFGVGAANYDANGHYARIQPIFNAFQLARAAGRPAAARAAAGRAAPRRPADRHAASAARAPPASPPSDGSAPFRDSGGNLDCDPTPGAGRPMIRDRRRSSLLVAVVIVRRRRPGRLARGRAGLPGARDLRQRRLRDPRRGRQDRRRQGRQDRVARRHRRTSRPPSCSTSPSPATRTSARDASCIVRPQNLIGERFVECKPTQRALGQRRAAAASCSEIDDGPGEGQHLLPVEQHDADGRHRPDRQHDARARARAAVADPQRARHRRSPAAGATSTRSSGAPTRRCRRPTRCSRSSPRQNTAARAARGQLGHDPRAAGARPRAAWRARSATPATSPRRRPSGATRSPPTSRRCREFLDELQADDGAASARWPTSRRRCSTDLGAQAPDINNVVAPARPVLAGRDPGRRLARRGGQDRHARRSPTRGP